MRKHYTKEDIDNIIFQKLEGKVKLNHIQSVTQYLLEEMWNDFKADKVIKIYNFCKIWMLTTKSRAYRHFDGSMRMSKGGTKYLKFKINKVIGDRIKSNIDLDKTFPNP